MKNKVSMMGVALVLLFLGTASVGSACEAVGDNKHVGPVLEINPANGTFMIRDAETGEPMIFEASSEILKVLSVEARVMVSYKEENGKLIAVEVQS
jgi:hypothetical protein